MKVLTDDARKQDVLGIIRLRKLNMKGWYLLAIIANMTSATLAATKLTE